MRLEYTGSKKQRVISHEGKNYVFPRGEVVDASLPPAVLKDCLRQPYFKEVEWPSGITGVGPLEIIPGNDISVVIPVGLPESSRNAALEYLKQYYSYQLGAELVVSPDYSIPYRKSVAINRGIARATNDLLLIIDADILVQPDILQEGIDAVRNGAPAAFPCRHVLDLTPAGTEFVYQLHPSQVSGIEPEGEIRTRRLSTTGRGGFQIFTRATFESVRGYDERFSGWGGEDVCFALAVYSLVGRGYDIKGEKPHFHLWHTKPLRLVSPSNRKYWSMYEQRPKTNRPRRRTEILETIKKRIRPLDFFSWQDHYTEHLLAIWDALPEEARGRFVFRWERCDRKGIELYSEMSEAMESLNETGRGPVVVPHVGARIRELKRPVIKVHHGAGQIYGDPRRGRDNHEVIVDLVPNESTAKRLKSKKAGNPIVVGCPKMDKWYGFHKERGTNPVVCLSFHFDLTVTPEQRSAWPYYQNVLPLLKGCNLVGHGHPRMLEQLRPWYEQYGIEVIDDFNEVMRRADLYVMDHMSCLYEFAATDRPVVVLNAPWYRRHIDYGLRYWEYANVGINCDKPEDLPAAIERALEDPPKQQELRHRAIEHVFPYFGHSARVAAQALMEVSCTSR